MAVLVRHNGAAANALGGLERGLAQGFGFGLQLRNTREAEARGEAHRRLAIEEAQRIDQQLQLENAQSQAASEGLAQTIPQPEKAAYSLPKFGARVSPIERRKMLRERGMERLRAIIPRMKPEHAAILIEEARRADKEQTQQDYLDDQREQFSQAIADGAYRIKPSALMSDEDYQRKQGEIDKAAQTIAKLYDNGGDPTQIAMMESGLRRSIIESDTRNGVRESRLMELESDIASLGSGGMEQAGGKPKAGQQQQQQPADGQANIFRQAQLRTLHMLKNAYERSPELYDNDRMAMAFEERWADAMNGVQDMGTKYGKVPLSMVPRIQAAELELTEKEAALKAAQARGETRQPRATGITEDQSIGRAQAMLGDEADANHVLSVAQDIRDGIEVKYPTKAAWDARGEKPGDPPQTNPLDTRTAELAAEFKRQGLTGRELRAAVERQLAEEARQRAAEKASDYTGTELPEPENVREFRESLRKQE